MHNDTEKERLLEDICGGVDYRGLKYFSYDALFGAFLDMQDELINADQIYVSVDEMYRRTVMSELRNVKAYIDFLNKSCSWEKWDLTQSEENAIKRLLSDNYIINMVRFKSVDEPIAMECPKRDVAAMKLLEEKTEIISGMIEHTGMTTNFRLKRKEQEND
ncbi:hypothetical protein [Dialister sp.]|uniref:hypothetical protein n=1 Tax=Dialister sp. TaxID=1955814 RepID=UPI00257BBEBF|nr:hypothetical protein [Dialister sp.]